MDIKWTCKQHGTASMICGICHANERQFHHENYEAAKQRGDYNAMCDRCQELDRRSAEAPGVREAEREVIEAAKEYPTEEMGIYPAAVKGNKNPADDYEQRTPEMEEHNRKCTRLVVALARLAAASKPADTKTEPCHICGGEMYDFNAHYDRCKNCSAPRPKPADTKEK